MLALLHVYIGMQLLPGWDAGGRLAGAAVLVLSSVLIPAAFVSRFRDGGAWDLVAWAGFLDLGLFSSTLVFTIVRELVLLLPHTAGWVRPSALAVPAAALLVSLIGFVQARRTARVVDVQVQIAHLAPALHGFTIAQISDIHVGPTIKASTVQAIVERVNALQPDLIAVTGDVVDGTVERLRTHTAPLARLRARHGAWLVPGNHEYYSGVHAWLAEFSRLGLRCLLDEHVVLEHAGSRLVLAGITDPQGPAFDPAHRSDPHKAIEGAPAGVPRILLGHQPVSSTQAAQAGFDLHLAGHTHGGQFWPWNHVVPLQQPFVAGLHRVGRLQVYVSRGTGYWGPPKRFGAPSEITRIRLVAAA